MTNTASCNVKSDSKIVENYYKPHNQRPVHVFAGCVEFFFVATEPKIDRECVSHVHKQHLQTNTNLLGMMNTRM